MDLKGSAAVRSGASVFFVFCLVWSGMRYVVVDGNIGAGKSTLLSRLEGSPGLRVIPEPVERWCSPFTHRGEAVPAPLEMMYRDSARYSLAFQIHVLTTRAQQLAAARDECGEDALLVLERDPFDFQLFVEDKYRAGEFDAFQHSAFTELADTVRGCFDVECAGGVYLRLEPGECMRRVRERGREAEASLDADRLRSLHLLHEAKYAEADAGFLSVDARQSPDEIASAAMDHLRALKEMRA